MLRHTRSPLPASRASPLSGTPLRMRARPPSPPATPHRHGAPVEGGVRACACGGRQKGRRFCFFFPTGTTAACEGSMKGENGRATRAAMGGVPTQRGRRMVRQESRWSGRGRTPTLKAVKGSHKHPHHHTQLKQEMERCRGRRHTHASASPAPFPPSAQQQRIRISPADGQAKPQKTEGRACEQRGGSRRALPNTRPLPFPPAHTNAHRHRYTYKATRTLA